MTQPVTSTATLHRWDEITPEPMSPLLTRQYVSGEQCMIARIVLKQGCVVPTHQHPNEQIAYILSGALEFNVAGTIHIVRAGHVLVIPATCRTPRSHLKTRLISTCSPRPARTGSTNKTLTFVRPLISGKRGTQMV